MAKRRVGSQIASLGDGISVDSRNFRERFEESNWSFDPRPEKVRNRPNLLSYRGLVTYRWKYLDKGYNFALDRTSI
jgi:hypothetical protein